jgi:hypothetical protein
MRRCGVVAGAKWSIDPKVEQTWVVFTNLPECNVALDLVPGLTRKSIVDIAEVGNFRCTAQSTRNSQVMSGVCYLNGQADAYFVWGATAPAYDHPTPCDRCRGIPHEHLAIPAPP